MAAHRIVWVRGPGGSDGSGRRMDPYDLPAWQGRVGRIDGHPVDSVRFDPGQSVGAQPDEAGKQRTRPILSLAERIDFKKGQSAHTTES